MRQLGSVLVAALLAPLGFVLTGRGLGGLAEVAAAAPAAEQTDYFAITTSAASLCLAGLTFALLTMARLPPLGPGLAGAGYLVVGIWALVSPDHLQTTFPGGYVGLDGSRLAVAATVAPLLAVPLLLTLFMPGRWQRRDRPGWWPRQDLPGWWRQDLPGWWQRRDRPGRWQSRDRPGRWRSRKRPVPAPVGYPPPQPRPRPTQPPPLPARVGPSPAVMTPPPAVPARHPAAPVRPPVSPLTMPLRPPTPPPEPPNSRS